MPGNLGLRRRQIEADAPPDSDAGGRDANRHSPRSVGGTRNRLHNFICTRYYAQQQERAQYVDLMVYDGGNLKPMLPPMAMQEGKLLIGFVPARRDAESAT